MFAIKGTEVQSRQQFLEKNYGAGTYVALLQELPEGDREILLPPILDIQLYPAMAVTALNHAICRKYGNSKESFFRMLGAFSAEQTSDALFRVNRGKPENMLQSTEEMFHHYYAGGWMRSIFPGGNRALLEMSLPEPDRCHCLTGEGFFKRCLERCGVKRVEIAQSECQVTGAPSCRLHLSWEL